MVTAPRTVVTRIYEDGGSRFNNCRPSRLSPSARGRRAPRPPRPVHCNFRRSSCRGPPRQRDTTARDRDVSRFCNTNFGKRYQCSATASGSAKITVRSLAVTQYFQGNNRSLLSRTLIELLRNVLTITIEVTRDFVGSDLDEVAPPRVDKVGFVKPDYELIQYLFNRDASPFVISLVGLAFGGREHTRAVRRPIFTVYAECTISFRSLNRCF